VVKLFLVGTLVLFWTPPVFAQVNPTESGTGSIRIDPGIKGTLPDAPLPKKPEDERSACTAGSVTPCSQQGPRPAASQQLYRADDREPRVADMKFWFVAAGSAAASLLATGAGMHCRKRNGVEPCTEHYGSFSAMEGVRFGVSGIGIPFLAYKLKKEDSGWENRHSVWWVFPAIAASINLGFAIREFNQGCNSPRLPNGGRCSR
jgi:hypothetical protein